MNMKRFLVATAIVSICAPTVCAEILYDQMTNFSPTIITSSWLAPDGYDGDTYAYDNFLLQGDGTIDEVWWVGGGGTISGVTVRFYTGLAAAPDLQPTITALPEEEREGDYLKGYAFSGIANQTPIPGSSLYQYHVVLPTSISLPANTVYWVKIEGDAVGYPSWGLATATHGRDSRHFKYFTGAHMFFGMTGSEAFQLRGTFALATVAGHVELQDFGGPLQDQVCEFTIKKGGNVVDTQVAALGSDGSYEFQTSVRGTVIVLAKATHWLRKATATNLNLTGGGLSAVDFSLINGDCDEDNENTLVDWGIVSASFGKSVGEAGFDPRADLDGDTEVNLVDSGILAAHFGQAGD